MAFPILRHPFDSENVAMSEWNEIRPWQAGIVATSMFVGAWHTNNDLWEWEGVGGPKFMPAPMAFLYDIGGRPAAVALPAIVGLFFLSIVFRNWHR